MSKLIATVKDIKNVENLNIVTFNCEANDLVMMSLELDKSIKIGKKVILGAKPSSVAIAKDFSGMVSYSNQLKSKIRKITKGELLCSLEIKFKDFLLESIITTNSLKKMDLKEDDEITVFIKASELSILEVFDD